MRTTPSDLIQHPLEVAKEIVELIGAGFGTEDVIIGGVIEMLAVEFTDEAARLASGFLTPFDAGRAIGHGELILGAGDADVEQAAFLVLGAIGDAAGVRQEPFLEADQIDDGKLQAF